MKLWQHFTNVIVGKTLLFKNGAVMKVVSAAGVESTIDLAELAAIDAIAAADLAKIDGITNGTAANGKALVLGSSGEIATITSATITTLTTGAIAAVDASLGVTGLAAAQGGADVVGAEDLVEKIEKGKDKICGSQTKKVRIITENPIINR